MDNIKFSVIVANYNNGKYLIELIDSILQQTYPHWELVITDDCSTDNSIEILEKYHTDSRIKVIRHQNNKGASATFRTAIEHTTGDIIGMLGADDALVANALHRIIDKYKHHPNASLIYSKNYKCNNDMQIIGDSGLSKKATQKNDLIRGCSYINSFVTFPKIAYQKTEGFDTHFKRALDQDLFLKLEEVGEIVFIEEFLYLYRTNPIGISQFENSEKARLYHIEALRKAYYRRKKNNFVPNISKDFLNYYLRYYYLRNAENSLNTNKLKSVFYLLRNIWLLPKDIFNVVVIKIFKCIFWGDNSHKSGNILPIGKVFPE